MKRVLIALGFFFMAIMVFSACDTQHRCAAYGHYTEVVADMEQNNQL